MHVPLKNGWRSLIVCFLSACAADESSSTLSRRQCERYRDHVVNLRLNEVSPTIPTRDLESHRVAMKQGLGDNFVAECEQKLSSADVRCGLAASDLSTAASCASADQN